MRIHKLQSTDAFIAIDLAGAEASSGPVRWAKKVLQGGAKDLARSQTYTYAVLGMRRGGASAGISAEPDARATAIEAFTAELAPLVVDATYLPDAAKGVSPDDLAALRADDPRDTARSAAFLAQCDGLAAAVAADATVELDGRTIAIEGHSASSGLATAVAERGGRIIAVSDGSCSVTAADGFDPAALGEGADLPTLAEPGDVDAIFDAGADVVFVGSKVGVVDHVVAARLGNAAAVIPHGRLPLTARGLAVLRSNGVASPADFLAQAGSTIARWGDAHRSDDEILATVRAAVAGLSRECAAHADGPLLAACYVAESYLSTWQDELPWGRPLAP